MANNLGDFDASAVIYGKFTTVQSTGAPTTLAGTPALSVYKDNSTTQSTSGVTLTADFDSVTGLNHFAIDTSSDGTFYSVGSFFDIVITTGTVNSVSAVGYCVGQFTIRKTSALKPATAGRTLVVDASGLADATTVKLGPSGSGTAQTARDIGASVLLSSGTGTGQVKLSSGYVAPNWGDIGNPTTTVNLSGTTVKTATDIATQISALNNITAASVWAVATRELTSGANIQLPANGLANVTAWTVAITGNITGNLSGSVGSVSGAVGSVTGNVGGNVTGSVGSVVGLTAAYLDVAVSTRLAAASYTAPDNAGIAAIQNVTDNLPDGGLLTSIAQASALATAQADLDTITGADGVTLATLQPNYAPAKASDVPTADDNANALMDLTDGVEANLTPRQWFRLGASALMSKSSGLATTTAVYRDFNDSKARITATVDADGNRTAVTTDST